MSISFDIVRISWYRVYLKFINLGWFIIVLLFVILGPGSVLAFDILGRQVFIIFYVSLVMLFITMVFVVKSKKLILANKRIEFDKDQIRIFESSYSNIVYNLESIDLIKIFHTSEFKYLSEEADINDGLDNFIIIHTNGKMFKYQFQINLKEDNTSFLRLVNYWKEKKYNIQYSRTLSEVLEE